MVGRVANKYEQGAWQKMKLRTIKHNKFYSKLPKYIFVKEDADINPETNLPYSKKDWIFLDMDWASFNAMPPIDDEGADMVLWAIVLEDDENNEDEE
jgi:hypothetical protein